MSEDHIRNWIISTALNEGESSGDLYFVMNQIRNRANVTFVQLIGQDPPYQHIVIRAPDDEIRSLQAAIGSAFTISPNKQLSY